MNAATMQGAIYRRCGKRCFDLTLIIVVAPLVLPLLATVALVVWLTLGRPVLFAQVRPGQQGRPFRLIKFRTMTDGGDGEANLLADVQRLTRIGLFLRSTSLDELPELWNVFMGDMSLVGPRPLLMEYLPLYTPEQARRQEVKPGITGWAQVNGRNNCSWEEKFALDVWYVDNYSFWLDLKILFMTIKKVILREGISAVGEATMPRFTGTIRQDMK